VILEISAGEAIEVVGRKGVEGVVVHVRVAERGHASEQEQAGERVGLEAVWSWSACRGIARARLEFLRSRWLTRLGHRVVNADQQILHISSNSSPQQIVEPRRSKRPKKYFIALFHLLEPLDSDHMVYVVRNLQKPISRIIAPRIYLLRQY
jgi:hypothetical protein